MKCGLGGFPHEQLHQEAKSYEPVYKNEADSYQAYFNKAYFPPLVTRVRLLSNKGMRTKKQVPILSSLVTEILPP